MISTQKEIETEERKGLKYVKIEGEGKRERESEDEKKYTHYYPKVKVYFLKYKT